MCMLLIPVTLGDKKVSVVTQIYPHKLARKIKWPSAVTKLMSHFT